jgi:hypothetical protein
MYSSCNYPESCDCSDCENARATIRIAKDFKRIGNHLKKLQPKRKNLNYDSRKLLIKYYWEDVQYEYNEANHPTNIYNMFCEILESMPQKSLKDCNTLSLFQSALEDTIGKENIQSNQSKNKTYI